MKVDIFPFFKKCTGTCFSFFLSHTATAQNRFIFTGSGSTTLSLSLVVIVKWDLVCHLVVTVRWDLACPWSSV